MTYKSHRITAFTLALAVWKVIGGNLILALVLSVIGSLAPDIDHAKSRIGQRLSRTSNYINDKYGHRGITHSLLGTITVSLIVYVILVMIGLESGLKWFILGYLSHLITDMFNPTGIPLFYPYSKKYGLNIISTGSKDEREYYLGMYVILFYSVMHYIFL